MENQINVEQPKKEAKTLRDYRTLNNLTMEDMGELLAIHPQTYATLEKNPDRVSIKQAKLLAAKFGVTINDIFFDNDI